MDKIIYDTSFVYRLCLDEFDSKSFQGRVYSSRSDEIITFTTFEDFLVKMDLYMDRYGPQAYQDKRTFKQSNISIASYHNPKETALFLDRMKQQAGEVDTYTICLYSRRNAEWQGCLYHGESFCEDFCNIIDFSNVIISMAKN